MHLVSAPPKPLMLTGRITVQGLEFYAHRRITVDYGITVTLWDYGDTLLNPWDYGDTLLDYGGITDYGDTLLNP
jgi:hypothetical protein